MKTSQHFQGLSRRERQIMDAVFQLGEATANQIGDILPDAPSNSTVRMLLRILEEKGQLKHRKEGRSFIYQPAQSSETVQASAISHLVKTFFGGSTARAVAGLIDHSETEITDEEAEELGQLIEHAKEEGR